MNEKNIPFKNYIILSCILILSVVLVIYFYMWYGTFEESRNNSSVLNGYLSVINYNELGDYLAENKNAVIYVSVLGSDEIKKFENKFKVVIGNYDLNNVILYLDLSSEISDDKLSTDVELKYGLEYIPCIAIFKDGHIYDTYDLKSNNYNVDRVTKYLKDEGVIND